MSRSVRPVFCNHSSSPALPRPLAAASSPERWIGLALGPIALAALVLGWFTR